MPVGDAHFWIIGRDPCRNAFDGAVFCADGRGVETEPELRPTNALADLPRMTLICVGDPGLAQHERRGLSFELRANEVRADKSAPFETVDELRLVYGTSIDMLVGDDVNRNGILDVNEKSDSGTRPGRPRSV